MTDDIGRPTGGSALALAGSAVPSPRVFGDIALVAFLLTQASDGVLTYVGVSTYGLTIEGNPLIAWLMNALGYGPGLATAKVTASVFGIMLHLTAVHRIVALLAAFYMVVAICPWVAILFLT